jgi:hypothetical protein
LQSAANSTKSKNSPQPALSSPRSAATGTATPIRRAVKSAAVVCAFAFAGDATVAVFVVAGEAAVFAAAVLTAFVVLFFVDVAI